MELTSRFFTYDDKQLNKMDDFEIPQEWWSRPYEYYFASQFLKKTDVILDAACGIEHPFKFYAAKRVKKVYAIDIDERIIELKSTNTLEFNKIDLTLIDTIYPESTFDKIFCISVLEHMAQDNILKTLEQLKKALKPGGMIVLTIDHPFLRSDDLVNLVNAAGLSFVSDYDYEKGSNAIKGPYNGLKCYSALLQDENKKEDIKEIKPKEAKPLFVKETK